MVSRRTKPSYTLPAGKLEAAADAGQFDRCATRETLEEAGVHGEVICELGCYTDFSKDGVTRHTRFFAMASVGEAASWDEAAQRERRWVPLAEAQRLVASNPILEQALCEVERRAC